MSKFILLRIPIFSKKAFNLIISNFCPILTDPMFPDLIKICSTVRSDGILLSYSDMLLFPHCNLFSKFKNSVSVLIKPSSNPAATVKVLNTEPNSYTPYVALLIKLRSTIFSLLLRSKSGYETIDIISPLLTFIKIAVLPLPLNID